MNAHTPGPWHVEGEAVVGPAGEMVADVWGYNARLIAAAPELLAVLERVLAGIVTTNDGGSIDAARAAIARAREEG